MRSGTHCSITKTVIARMDDSLQRTNKSDRIDWPIGNGRGVFHLFSKTETESDYQ